MSLRRKRASAANAQIDSKRIKNLDHGRCELLETGNFSDFVIASKSCEFKVHRACLVGSSPYFDGVIDSGLSESREQRLTLDQEQPDAIFLILWYIYTKTYPAMKHSHLEWCDEREAAFLRAAPASMPEFKSHLLIPHLEVYKLSDMMMLPKLKEIAYDELRDQILEFPGSAVCKGVDSIKDENHECVPWTKQEDFQDAIRMVYMSPGTNLSELQEFFAWGSIFNESNHGSRRFLEDIVKGVNDYGWDLYVERDDYGSQNAWSCHHCRGLGYAWPNLIVLEDEYDHFKILNCKCWYRGFCSKSCKGYSEGFQERIAIYCSKCCTGTKKSWTFDYVLRTKNGLEVVADGSTCKLMGRGVYLKVESDLAI